MFTGSIVSARGFEAISFRLPRRQAYYPRNALDGRKVALAKGRGLLDGAWRIREMEQTGAGRLYLFLKLKTRDGRGSAAKDDDQFFDSHSSKLMAQFRGKL